MSKTMTTCQQIVTLNVLHGSRSGKILCRSTAGAVMITTFCPVGIGLTTAVILQDWEYGIMPSHGISTAFYLASGYLLPSQTVYLPWPTV